MPTPIGVGVVGTGLSATQHLTAFAEGGDAIPAHVVAVAATSPEKAEAFAHKWTIPRAHASVEALVQDPEVHSVHACTPSDGRIPIARLCAAHGKHLLVEKPIARTLAEADELIATCDRAGITLGVLFQNRFTPLARRVKAALDGGELGPLHLINVTAKWYRHAAYYRDSGWRGTAREGGAVLINQAIHAIDLVRWLAGPVDEVQGLAATVLHPIEMEDVGMALLRFRSGALGSIVATTAAYPGFSDRIELHGARGTLALVQDEGRLEWYLEGQEPRVEQDSGQVSGAGRDAAKTPSAGRIAAFTDFYDAIRSGRTPAIDGREGRHALEIVEAIYRSSRERGPVTLPL